MKQQAIPGSSEEEVTQQTAVVESASSEQDLLGNQAILEAMDEKSKAPGDQVKEAEESEEQDAPSQDADHDKEPTLGPPVPDTPQILVDAMKEHEQVEEEAEKEAEGPPDLAKRATNVRVGMSGAVVGSKENYDVKAEAGTEASTSDSVTDGTYVTVTEVSGAHAKIEFRKGTSLTAGWINAALFSPQPKLGKDDDNKELPEDLSYELAEGEQTPGDEIEGADVQQGGLADCFFIASLNAIANADPKFFEEAITYDSGSGLYSIRFYERSEYNYDKGGWDYAEHTEIVDGYLPTRADGENAYAKAKDASEWGAIYEKGYAQWKGGYVELDKGGSSSKAMQELTGVQSVPQSISSLKTEDIIPFFENAQENGTAVICGSQESMESAAQTPLHGGPTAAPEELLPVVEAEPAQESETESVQTEETPQAEEETEQVFHAGPYAGTLATDNSRQRVKAGTVEVRDAGGNVSVANDSGGRGDKDSEMKGGDVASGKIAYKPKTMDLTYNDGKGPAKASDLEVKFRYQGLIFPSKKVFAWHAYVFKEVKDGKIQLFNPWGSWHPDALSAEELQTYFSNLSTNQVPQTQETEAGE